MLMPPKKFDWAENLGLILGVIAGGAATLLITALVIHWLIGATGLTAFFAPTYTQTVGLLAIWEIIKPRTASK